MEFSVNFPFEQLKALFENFNSGACLMNFSSFIYGFLFFFQSITRGDEYGRVHNVWKKKNNFPSSNSRLNF